MKNILFICFIILGSSLVKAQVIKDSIIVKKHPPSQFMKVLNECQNELKYNTAGIKEDGSSATSLIRFIKRSRRGKALYSFDAFRCANFSISKGKDVQLCIGEFIYKDKAHADNAFSYLKMRGSYPLSEIYMYFTWFQMGTSVFIVLSEYSNEPIQDVIKHLSAKYHGT